MPETLEEEQQKQGEPSSKSQEWEAMSRAWLTAFPEAKAVGPEEVEAWVGSNFCSLPSDLKSMPRSDLIDRLLSIQDYFKLSNHQVTGVNLIDLNHARFRRSDQWLPVYSWLESLDKDEPVKSKDIIDWFNENPEIREQLYSRHSRYHLMHYIKKCHMKILKRKERQKGVQPSVKLTSPTAEVNVHVKEPAWVPKDPVSNLPKDSDLYLTKRKEARKKYEILVALEKLLTPHFGKPQEANR